MSKLVTGLMFVSLFLLPVLVLYIPEDSPFKPQSILEPIHSKATQGGTKNQYVEDWNTLREDRYIRTTNDGVQTDWDNSLVDSALRINKNEDQQTFPMAFNASIAANDYHISMNCNNFELSANNNCPDDSLTITHIPGAIPFLSGFQTREYLKINGSTDGELINQTLTMYIHYDSGTSSYGEVPHIYTSGLVQTDFDDIRFTEADGQSLLPFWRIETDPSNYTFVAFNIPIIPDILFFWKGDI